MAETERQLQRFFMNKAFSQAESSKCLKLKVGAVVVKDNIIVGWGCNTSVESCTECTAQDGHCNKAFHAETNAILQAIHNGVLDLSKCTIYVTHLPCIRCAEYIVAENLEKVVYAIDYIDDREDVISYLQQNNVQVDKCTIEK